MAANVRIAYRDKALDRLEEDIARVVVDGSGDPSSIAERLDDLACRNAPEVARYWQRTRRGLGVPDAAFKRSSVYFFPEETPARTFRTSGTSGAAHGHASFSARGMRLLDLSILTNARRHVIAGLDRPIVLRLVPPAQAAPEMIMAYGMELIAGALGDPETSASVVGGDGVDLDSLAQRLDAAIRDERPVVLIGASFAFVNVCDALEGRGRRWELPRGSRIVDAGGFKGRSRIIAVDELRALAGRVFGVPPDGFVNLFGMTELASQLYDASGGALGPAGERPKGRLAFVEPRVRDPRTMDLVARGAGLLEVRDLCILDRPSVILTGDRAIGSAEGVAITGRIAREDARGCSITLDRMTDHHGEVVARA